LVSFQELIYAATERGVFRLVDGRWQACNEGLPADRREVSGIVAHPKGRVYLLERTSGLYVWNEGQKKWEGRGLGAWQLLRDRQPAYKALAVDPQDPDIVFMSTDPEVWPHLLYKSSDAGKSWRKISSFHLDPQAPENFAKALEGVEEIAFSPAEPQKVFLTDWSNVWQSRDGGENWLQLHKGLQNTVVNAIRVHPFDAQKIFLAVADNGLVFSGDGGESWKRKMKGVLEGHAQTVEISRRESTRMYLLMNPWNRKDRVWVYKSSNGGENWEDISFPVPPGTFPRLGFVD